MEQRNRTGKRKWPLAVGCDVLSMDQASTPYACMCEETPISSSYFGYPHLTPHKQSLVTSWRWTNATPCLSGCRFRRSGSFLEDRHMPPLSHNASSATPTSVYMAGANPPLNSYPETTARKVGGRFVKAGERLQCRHLPGRRPHSGPNGQVFKKHRSSARP